MRNIGYALMLCAGLVGCSAAPDASSQFNPAKTPLMPLDGGKTIGPGGGRVSVGPLTLDFPPGAVSERVHITVVPVQPGRPADPTDEIGPAVPVRPPVTFSVWVRPEDLSLSQPVRVTFATGADVTTAALALALPRPTHELAWEPLPGQGRSPGLVWSLSRHLGIFGLVQVDCCSGVSGVGDCSLRCDVGPLHYVCDGRSDDPTCCDPFTGSPQEEPLTLCQISPPDLGR